MIANSVLLYIVGIQLRAKMICDIYFVILQEKSYWKYKLIIFLIDKKKDISILNVRKLYSAMGTETNINRIWKASWSGFAFFFL